MKPVKTFFATSAAAIFIALALTFCQTVSNADAAAPTPEYSQWLRKHQQGTSNWQNPRFLKLHIAAVEGEKPLDAVNDLLGTHKVSYGCLVYSDGFFTTYYSSSMGVKGGGRSQTPLADFGRLEQLLKTLPDDGGVLPPLNRRLLFEISDGEKFNARVYDRANAPDVVWEIVRLSLANIGSFVPEFSPNAQWTAHEHEQGALSVSPDEKTIVSSSIRGPFKFWDSGTHELIKTIATPQSQTVMKIVFSPNASQVAIAGWAWSAVHIMETANWQSTHEFSGPMMRADTNPKSFAFSNPQWALDGKFLLLQKNERELNKPDVAAPLQIFDAQTGERIESLPQVPEGAFACVSASNGKRAIIVSKRHAIALWDVEAQREIAVLDEAEARLHRVAFSPDGNLVAVATVHKSSNDYYGDYRLRIWNAQTGVFLRELRPFEKSVCRAIEGLVWSPDSRYVLAATEYSSFSDPRGISIWNAQSGRHRGELTGPPTNVNGMALLADGKIVAGCNDGVIRTWDLQNALMQIASFEKSLATH